MGVRGSGHVGSGHGTACIGDIREGALGAGSGGGGGGASVSALSAVETGGAVRERARARVRLALPAAVPGGEPMLLLLCEAERAVTSRRSPPVMWCCMTTRS